MFILQYFEHSPRVTLLQILLKDEYSLKIDGIFGPKTLAALKAFQQSAGSFQAETPRRIPGMTCCLGPVWSSSAR
jgi:peptidoglycan hydrolase-like protein with peptidoglycan-binding domain